MPDHKSLSLSPAVVQSLSGRQSRDSLFKRVKQLKKLVEDRANKSQRRSKPSWTEEPNKPDPDARKASQVDGSGDVDKVKWLTQQLDNSNLDDSVQVEQRPTSAATIDQPPPTEIDELEMNQIPAVTELTTFFAKSDNCFTPETQFTIHSKLHSKQQQTNLKTETLSPFTADLLSLRRKRQHYRNTLVQPKLSRQKSSSGLANPGLVQPATPTATSTPVSLRTVPTNTKSNQATPSQSNCHRSRKRVYKTINTSGKLEVHGARPETQNDQLKPEPTVDQVDHNPWMAPPYQHYYPPYYGQIATHPHFSQLAGSAPGYYSDPYHHHNHHQQQYATAADMAESYPYYGPYGPWLSPQHLYPGISVHPFYSNYFHTRPDTKSQFWSPYFQHYPNPSSATKSASFPSSEQANPSYQFGVHPAEYGLEPSTPDVPSFDHLSANSQYLSKKDSLVSKFVAAAAATPIGSKQKVTLAPPTTTTTAVPLFEEPASTDSLTGQQQSPNRSNLNKSSKKTKPRFDISSRRDSVLAKMFARDEPDNSATTTTTLTFN